MHLQRNDSGFSILQRQGELMEILKQPLPRGGFLPTGETHCPESWDTAKGCRTGNSPAQARGFTPHQFSFQRLLYEQQSVLPTAKQWLRSCRRQGSGDARQQPEGKERNSTAKQSTASASTGLFLCLARVRHSGHRSWHHWVSLGTEEQVSWPKQPHRCTGFPTSPISFTAQW